MREAVKQFFRSSLGLVVVAGLCFALYSAWFVLMIAAS